MTSTESPRPWRSVSSHRLLSRLRLQVRRLRAPKHDEHEDHLTNDNRKPLSPLPLPLVLPEHRHLLSQLGWTIVTIPQPSSGAPVVQSPQSHHPLQAAFENLFRASAVFFSLPDEEKVRWKTRLGSEEGWSKIPGEKEFITLRTLSYTPHILEEPAKRYWDLMGNHLDACLGRISSSLQLPEGETDGLRKYVGPCKRMGDSEQEKTATMLRLFRYEGWEEKTVAEPHADLGLLSCVVGNVPGLEVWNGTNYIAIEKNYITPCATLLSGRQLERLTNYRYPAGGHQVVSYGYPATPGLVPSDALAFRFSIVFVLRAHESIEVDSDLLTTEITGPWDEPLKGVTVEKWYEQVRSAHFNININQEEREKQRRKLEKDKSAKKIDNK